MPDILWYAQRLKAMSLPEVAFRLRRACEIQLQRLPGLKAVVPPVDWEALRLPGASRPEVDAAPYTRKADGLLHNRMDVFAATDCFLGEPIDWNRDPKTGVSAPLELGKLIDYRDERVVGNIKYLWEPGRHLQLPPLAQAYRLTGDRKYLDHLVRLLDSWIRQCPWPYGVHWCSSLEVAIRLINWSFAWRIAGGPDALREAGVEEAFLGRWLDSIYRHLTFIDGYYSAWSSANNHLIGEAAGVYIGAVTWPAWREIEALRRRAKCILIAEIENQTHADGVNAEQAISYQQFVLDFFVMAGLAGERVGDSFPRAYWANVERMLEFIRSMMDAGGNVPMVGDADDGFVSSLAPEPDFCNYRSLLATGAILFDRPDFARKAGALDSKSQWLLESAEERLRTVLSSTRHPVPPKRDFPFGGYYVLGADLESPEELRIIFDAGPLGMGSLAAHGHADALSFHLSVAGTPMIVDPGTYAYHTDRKWRDYFRGTSAHNTLRVDGQDQSVIGGNFMWARHAEAFVADYSLGEELQIVEASHDGYWRLDDPVAHRRRLSLDIGRRSLRIEDYLECDGAHDVELFFHFPEDAEIECGRESAVVRRNGQCLRIHAEHGFARALFHGDEQRPLGWISYRFDSKMPAYTLRYAGAVTASTALITTIDLD